MKTTRLAISVASAVLIASITDVYAGRALTLYLDGAQIEQREAAGKGYLEINLPPGSRQESLRIAPGKGVEILRVVTSPRKPAKSVETELTLLAEREELLHDRLKALSVREEIFRSAAKSQSAKAPRRTKSNPEPLSTIKQGTDYAITQLEAVYHSKRKSEKELAQIAERRLLLGRNEQSGGTVARVWITPAVGSVTATWQQTDRNWQPVYQLRINDRERATLTLMPQAVFLAKGETAELAVTTLQADGNRSKTRYEGEWTVIRKEEFKVTDVQNAGSSASSLTVSFTNSSALSLPAGDISCFKGGIYIGKGKFLGADVGKTAEVVCSSR